MTISKIVLMITSECNLGCGYCYSRGTIKQDKEKVKKTLLDVLERYPEVSFITVTGGEPLIEFEFLMELRALVPSKIRFGIISSCKLLTPQKLERIKGKNMFIRVSIDGTSAFEIKKLDTRISDFIRENLDLFSGVSKVISKLNYDTAYNDFMSIISTGIGEVDIIPELYVKWEDSEIETIRGQIDRIYAHIAIMENPPHINLIDDDQNRYMKCRKIQILPDGDLALCNSNSISGKNIYLSSDKLEKFDSFKQLLISNAVRDLKLNNLLTEDTKDLFCMVDYYYYEKIRGVKSDNMIKLQSGIKLFLAIRDAMRKNERPLLYN